ncbi:MAG: recombinase [Thiomicrospira sp.]|nr:MAG: recombinase [Thiomicrospira sp.]
MAQRLNVDPVEMQNIVLATVMPGGKNQPSNEQFVSFLAVANEYKLNPLTKEIYAFPTKGGGIQPIVSIDGWLKVINSQPDFNGMVHEDIRESGELIAITCKIYKKGIDHPVTVTEYMNECIGQTKDSYGNPTPWGRWPARMLRHKATIQAGRYAFGLSGIIDPDEADRYAEANVIPEQNQNQSTEKAIEYVSNEDFQKLYSMKPKIESGEKDPNSFIAFIESKGKLLTDDQKIEIATWAQPQEQTA